MNMNAPERDCRRGVPKTTEVADIWKVRHHDHNARAFKMGDGLEQNTHTQ